MGQRYPYLFNACLGVFIRAFADEKNFRFASCIVAHLYFIEVNAAIAPAGAQCFEERFLRRKTGGIAFGGRRLLQPRRRRHRRGLPRLMADRLGGLFEGRAGGDRRARRARRRLHLRRRIGQAARGAAAPQPGAGGAGVEGLSPYRLDCVAVLCA